MSEYAILLPGDEDAWAQSSAEQREAVYAVHREFMRRLEERGHVVTGGAELAHRRHTRVVNRGADGGVVVTDGPYAEGAEQLTGFYLVRTDDVEDLLQLAGLLAGEDGPVEVRPTTSGDPS
ncbi:YciI family protein [Microlunatus lacustris]